MEWTEADRMSMAACLYAEAMGTTWGRAKAYIAANRQDPAVTLHLVLAGRALEHFDYLHPLKRMPAPAYFWLGGEAP